MHIHFVVESTWTMPSGKRSKNGSLCDQDKFVKFAERWRKKKKFKIFSFKCQIECLIVNYKNNLNGIIINVECAAKLIRIVLIFFDFFYQHFMLNSRMENWQWQKGGQFKGFIVVEKDSKFVLLIAKKSAFWVMSNANRIKSLCPMNAQLLQCVLGF